MHIGGAPNNDDDDDDDGDGDDDDGDDNGDGAGDDDPYPFWLKPSIPQLFALLRTRKVVQRIENTKLATKRVWCIVSAGVRPRRRRGRRR